MTVIQKAQDVIQYNLVQILKNLKKNGIKDFTQENVTYQRGDNVIRVRFYTKVQWEVTENKATTAQIVMGIHQNGYKIPFTVVEFENVQYYVENLNRGK